MARARRLRIIVDGMRVIKEAITIQRRRCVQFKAGAIVYYETPYALYVHEDMNAHHAVGQALFLTTPTLAGGKTYGRHIYEQYKAGVPMSQALLQAAEWIRKESQKLCPVDTNRLKSSARAIEDPNPPVGKAVNTIKNPTLRKSLAE